MSEKDDGSIGQATPEEVKAFLEATQRMQDSKEKEEIPEERTIDLKEALFKEKPDPDKMQRLEGVSPEDVALALGVELPDDYESSDQEEEDIEHISLPNAGEQKVKEKVQKDKKSHSNQRAWAQSVAELGKITVSELEKRLFLKSALHDENVTWEITLEGMPDAPVTCRSLFEWELSLVFSALAEDAREGLVRNDEEYYANLQNYSVCLQVEKVGSTPYKHHFKTNEDNLREETNRLRKHMYGHIKQMSAPQKLLVFTALRIFHVKYDMCQSKLRDQNFWTPRD